MKLKNLKNILNKQEWIQLEKTPKVSICEFDYKAQSWSKPRKFKAIRTITGYKESYYFGYKQLIPQYAYACYCSTLELNALAVHNNYKQRSISETWIAEIKGQLLAGSTLTNSFYANDILWQIATFAYNLSIMMRYKIKKYWKQEHNTFRDWFINIPAKIVSSGRITSLKIYEAYYFRDKWEKLYNSL